MSRGPSVGEPGYLPYCGCCRGFVRCVRDADAFRCPVTGIKGRTVNGEDMFDRTAPRQAWTPPIVRRLSAESAEGAKGGCPDAGQGMGS